jgi:hypothetical protein
MERSEPVTLQALWAGARRSRLRVALVGLGTLLLGLFVGAVHAVGLDPEAARMGLSMVVLLYTVAVGFVFVGLGMLGVALLRGPRDAVELECLLREHPEEVVSARRRVANRYGLVPAAGEGTLGQHVALIESASGRIWSLNARPDEVTAILDLVAQQNPRADIEGR